MPDTSDTTPRSPDAASADLWRDATRQVRDTIKYVIAGFAAVGVILIGSAPLTNLDKLHGGWWLVAGAGGLLAIAGVMYAIWQASDVLLPDVITLDQVRDGSPGTDTARFRDSVLGGPEGLFRLWGGTVDSFRDRRDLDYRTLANLDAATVAEDNRAEFEEERRNLVASIEQLNSTAEIALAGAQYAQTRDLARSARRAIAIAALMVACGVGAFSIAVTRPTGPAAKFNPKPAGKAVPTITTQAPASTTTSMLPTLSTESMPRTN